MANVSIVVSLGVPPSHPGCNSGGSRGRAFRCKSSAGLPACGLSAAIAHAEYRSIREK